MEERENRKGPGVFYAVIGVATLVVAIIGATFAYFSVTLNSATDAVKGTTGQGTKNNVTLTVNKVSNGNGSLIPLNEENQMQQALTASCVDSNQNTVCQVYNVHLANTGENTVRLAGNLLLSSTASNMKWKLIGANAKTDATSTINGVGTAGKIEDNLTLAKDATQDYYLVVWLHETGKAQDDANKTDGATDEDNLEFTGQVTFNAVDANGGNLGGLTATFNTTPQNP